MENPTDKDRLLLKHQWVDRRFQCEDNNVAFTNVQPHYYRVRQVEPSYLLGEVAKRSTLAIEFLVLCFNNNSKNSFWS